MKNSLLATNWIRGQCLVRYIEAVIEWINGHSSGQSDRRAAQLLTITSERCMSNKRISSSLLSTVWTLCWTLSSCLCLTITFMSWKHRKSTREAIQTESDCRGLQSHKWHDGQQDCTLTGALLLCIASIESPFNDSQQLLFASQTTLLLSAIRSALNSSTTLFCVSNAIRSHSKHWTLFMPAMVRWQQVLRWNTTNWKTLNQIKLDYRPIELCLDELAIE